MEFGELKNKMKESILSVNGCILLVIVVFAVAAPVCITKFFPALFDPIYSAVPRAWLIASLVLTFAYTCSVNGKIFDIPKKEIANQQLKNVYSQNTSIKMLATLNHLLPVLCGALALLSVARLPIRFISGLGFVIALYVLCMDMLFLKIIQQVEDKRIAIEGEDNKEIDEPRLSYLHRLFSGVIFFLDVPIAIGTFIAFVIGLTIPTYASWGSWGNGFDKSMLVSLSDGFCAGAIAMQIIIGNIGYALAAKHI